MEKQLKDYLHLYLGCEVQYPNTDGKIIKATLTGVSRGDGIETTYKRKRQGCKGDYLSWTSNGYHKSDALHLKPILRPLSDLTEEEKEHSGEEPETVFQAAEQVKYLLSKHFDLFGLIEAGLAIDKTKQLN